MRNVDLSLNARNVWALIAFWSVAFVVFSLLLGGGSETHATRLLGV